MKIVVLVKHVPDAAGDRTFAADLTSDRAAVDGRLSELDEYAVEQALQLVEKAGEGEITYLTMGPAAAGEALRKALSMGGDAGVHVVDDALHGSDALATSRVLAAALGRLEWDLVVCGTDQTGEARYPSFKGIMAAKKKPVTTFTLADLGVEPGEVGLAGAWSEVRTATKRPPRAAGVVVTDEGDGGVKLAEFLATNKFI
jgi:electron transfer flavoprotein beta subunit